MNRRSRIKPPAARVRVARNAAHSRESFALSFACALYATANVYGSIAGGSSTQIAQRDGAHGHVHVDPVRQWSRDSCVVAVDVPGSAGARTRLVAGASARTWVRRAY